MNEQERGELIAKSIKARKLILPDRLQDLPFMCPNVMLLTDETCALIDERFELFVDFIYGLGAELNLSSSVWSLDEYADFTVNPFPNAVGVTYRGGYDVQFRKKPENVTLLDVWKACDKLLARHGDGHHVFIEELEFNGQYIAFACGS